MPQGVFNIGVCWLTDSVYSHCEAIFDDDLSRPVPCGSSSFIDDGVRIKEIMLNPDHWDVLDVPCFDAEQSRQWFVIHNGEPYDVLGLASVVLPGLKGDPDMSFCSEAILASVSYPNPNKIDPGRLYDLCVFLGGVNIPISV